MAQIDKYFKLVVEHKASDLHISTGAKPSLRKDGAMVAFRNEEILDAQTAKTLLYEIMPKDKEEEFNTLNDTDFAYELEGAGRFRCNIFRDHKGVGGVFRLIPTEILTCEQLSLPETVKKFCSLNKGLILVTGPTGSGKSTTLAALIDLLNSTRNDHIITIEDPIEFVHKSKKCLVNQRELGVHTLSFANALKSALREDPDIVLVGEMRDLETIQLALTAAETGHLVFGTLHTSSAPKTIDRVIDAFPPAQQAQIRTQLSEALEAVITQTLLKKKAGGRAAALEIMIATTAVRNLIREAKLHQIPGIMQASQRDGMQTMDMALTDLVTRGVVHKAEAQSRSMNPNLFGAAVSGAA